ncbi:hypothetical protein D9M68_839680 [compost metagenome]
MCLGVFRAVGMALDRDMRNRPLEQPRIDAMLAAVGGGQLGEVGRRHRIGIPLRNVGADRGHRQAAVAGVLELFHAQCDRDVAGTGGHRVHRCADGFGTTGAEVLHARHADVGQA